MKIFLNKTKLLNCINSEKNLGFVPTMGAIHLGHVSLIKNSIYQCNKTIVSIFINKQQFNKRDDFVRYPRILKRDISILRKLKVDYLYLPTTKQIYPKGPNKKIKISSFKKKLCGKFRPGHFEAVVDVVHRFLKIIKPRKLFLGKKDLQQLMILEEFINKNKITTKVVPCNTIREKNGIACSSRNFLLSTKNKRIASKIYKVLRNNKKKLVIKKITLRMIKKEILKIGANKIDYMKILDINKQTLPFKKFKKYKLFIAYYLGTTRLIDNI